MPSVQPVNAGTVNGVLSYPGMNPAQNFLQNMSNGQATMPATVAAPPPSMPQGTTPNVTPETLQQQLQILTALKTQGVPQDQWAAVLAVLMANGAGVAAAPAPNPTTYGTFGSGGRDDLSRDRNGYDQQYPRSPPGRYRNRSRSRSPGGWDRRREASPPRRRDSPVYGEYGNDRNGRNGDYRRGGARGGGRGESYRQRSPTRFRRSPSPRRQDQSLPAPGPKFIQYDHSIGQGKIKGGPPLIKL